METLTLRLIAFITSTIAAVFGLGGGLLLIAFMQGLVPAVAIIPVHAIVQFASNSSRVLFTYHHIHWEFCGAFLLG